MVEVMIWNPLERLLYGIAIAVFFMTGVLFILRGKKLEKHEGKSLMYGYAFFNIFFAMRNVFIFISEFYIIGSNQKGAFYGDYGQYYPDYEIYLSLAHIFIVLSFVSLLLGFEIHIKKTKCVFAIIESSFILLIVLLPFEIEKVVMILQTNYVMVVFFAINYYIMKKSKHELKSLTFLIYLSFSMILIGVLFTYPDTKSLQVVPLFTGALFFILGCFIIILPLIIEEETLSKSLNYYTLALGIAIFFSILAIFIVIQAKYAFISKIISVIAIIIVLLFLINSYLILSKDFKYPQKIETKDFLSAFSRPSKLTEEEVSVSKEKKICLVCKGKVARSNIFLCPECDTFYCSKCSDALSNLENACWVCETPFDESKPVRLPEKKEEEVVVEDVYQKKIKKK